MKKETIKQFTLRKSERLKKRSLIDQLFREGKTFFVHPLKLYYFLRQDKEEGEPPVQFGVSVSKRSFKKAVHRNRIKRLIREAYRIEKPALLQALPQKQSFLKLFFIYAGKDLPDLALIKDKTGLIMKRLEAEIQQLP